jgi:pSer/pThr/pTyr-binding forkhead associated (FHA) protein
MPDPENNKTTVNGQRGTSKTEIKHLDRLVIGHGNAFKVVIPTQKKDSDEQ